jgi:purine-cytosine permease-like protein
MTGVWTGTAVAVFLNMKFKDAVLPIVLGNLVAGVVISLLSELCALIWSIAVLDYILWALLGLAIILLVITIIKISRSGKKSELSEKE